MRLKKIPENKRLVCYSNPWVDDVNVYVDKQLFATVPAQGRIFVSFPAGIAVQPYSSDTLRVTYPYVECNKCGCELDRVWRPGLSNPEYWSCDECEATYELDDNSLIIQGWQ